MSGSYTDENTEQVNIPGLVIHLVKINKFKMDRFELCNNVGLYFIGGGDASPTSPE